MGSIEVEEEKLLQMVHDFIESESSANTSSPSSSSNKHIHLDHSTRYFTLQEILRKKTEEEKRIGERVGKHMRKKLEMEKRSGLSLKEWLVKCLKLDGFNASICFTSWVSTPGCPCGNYEYIEIMEQDAKGNSYRIIVDKDFESQFEVARPTQSYKELLSKLPTIFVGSEEKLKAIILVLCSAAEESLKDRGLHIPPWRRPTYMHSKWKLPYCPNHIKDPQRSDFYLKNSGNGASRFGERGPPMVMMKSKRRDKGGGSNLSNQFSSMSINCC